jgi:hypothetical protein
MIVKVIKGRAFTPLVEYGHNGDGRNVIGGNMAGSNPREWSKEVGQFRKLRPSLDRAVAHLILSAAPEDPHLDSATWCEIAEIFLNDLGLQACPHIIFRHTDTDHQHIHIACLRIGPDGKTVSEANDRYKAERSAARIEKRFGLRQVNFKKERPAKNAKDPPPEPVVISKNPSLPTKPKETEMQNKNESDHQNSMELMPEPIVSGSDLAVHAFSLMKGLEVMTAFAGDNPNERQRRNFKRTIKSTGYDKTVQLLLDPDVRHIHHHDRGSVIYLQQQERITDDGDRLTAYNMDHARAARYLVALAGSRGWTSIVFNGPHDFVLAAMREAVAQGFPVRPRDEAQRKILEQIMSGSGGAMGTVAVPAGFVPPEEPSFPYEEAAEPEQLQQAPEEPADQPLELNSNLATKLALRRQKEINAAKQEGSRLPGANHLPSN